MPYKFSSKKFTLNEKHPISKERFETSNSFLNSLTDSEDSESIEGLDKLKEIWRMKSEKLTF
jgi:hypothetical protein